MTRTHTIAKNTFFLVGSHLFNIAGRILFSILLVRYLGAMNLGNFFIALSFIELFNIITDLGLGIVVTREVASDKTQLSRYLSNTFLLKLILAFIAVALALIVSKIVPYSTDIRAMVYILLPSIFFNSFFVPFVYIFRAHEDMKRESIISFVSNFLYILLGLLAIYLKLNVFFIAAITTLVAFINFFLASLIYLIKYKAIRIGFELEFARRLLKTALPVGVGIMLSMAFSRIDVFLLSILKSSTSVGFYAAAYKPISAFLFLPYFLATSMFPLMSEWKKQERLGDLKILTEKIIRVMMIFIIPTAVFVSLISDRIILIIYGKQFLTSAPVLGLLVWYLVFIFPTFILTHLLFLSHTKQYAIFNLISLGANITLNLLLIPSLGIIGVAFAAIITALTTFLLSYWKIYTRIFKLNVIRAIIMPVVASLGIVLFVFTFRGLSLLQLSVWSIIIYLSTLYLIKGITRQDLTLLLSLVSSK